MKFEKVKGKVYGGKKVEESFSFQYKNIRKMVCTCGYQGICVDERCKKCRQEVKVKINEIVSKKPFYNELKDIEKENNLLKATVIVRDVFQNAKKYYLIKTEKLKLVFNIETGEMFANEQNITYSRVEKEQEETESLPPVRRNNALYLDEAMPMIGERRGIGGIDIMELVNRNYYNYNHPPMNIEKLKTNEDLNIYNIYKDLSKDRNILKDFFEFCAKERNVRFINIEKILKEEDGVQRILVLLRLPILEYAEEIQLNVLSKEIAEKLDKAKDGEEIWKMLIGHHGKEVKRLALKDVNFFNHMMRWGKHILKQENLVKIAKTFTFNRGQKMPMNAHDIVLGILSGVFQNEIYKTATIFFETMDEKQNMFEAGMRVIKSTHSNETVWVNRLLQFKEDMNESELYDYICDIGRMYEQVKKEFPSFISKKTSIGDIHDELSLWIKKIGVPCVELPFTDKMKNLEEDDFVFAKTSHELIDVGTEMKICVGSYWRRAYNGYCSIVLLKEENNPIVCIELDDNFAIKQAKMHCNNRPSELYEKKILAWAKKHQLPIKTYDLNFETRRFFNPIPVYEPIQLAHIDEILAR